MDALLVFLAPVMATLAGKYGFVVATVTWLGVIRLFVKPVMALAQTYVGITSSTEDDVKLEAVKVSKYYTGFIFVVDWLLSLKLQGPVEAPAEVPAPTV